MVSALVIFCLLCVSTVIFARWLVFDSPTQLNVTLHVGKGTVGLAEPETDEKAIRTSAVGRVGTTGCSTDNTSQGYLSFSDPVFGRHYRYGDAAQKQRRHASQRQPSALQLQR